MPPRSPAGVTSYPTSQAKSFSADGNALYRVGDFSTAEISLFAGPVRRTSEMPYVSDGVLDEATSYEFPLNPL